MTATVESHGGKFVARGGAIEVVLGEWAPKRIAILESDSLDRVHAWLSSPEYTALDDMRSRSSNINLLSPLVALASALVGSARAAPNEARIRLDDAACYLWGSTQWNRYCPA